MDAAVKEKPGSPPEAAGTTVEKFRKLNQRQRQAATAGNAPLLILAGAGTGKTNTLAHRVAHLLMQGTPPERILLLTFTRRAALEMTRRASRIVAQVKSDVRLTLSSTLNDSALPSRLENCRTSRLAME